MFKWFNNNKRPLLLLGIWIFVFYEAFQITDVTRSGFLGAWALYVILGIELKEYIDRSFSKMELRVRLNTSGEKEFEEELRKAFEAGVDAHLTDNTAERYVRDFKNRIYKV